MSYRILAACLQGKRAGLSTATSYLLEDGLLDVRVSTLVKLARALNVTPGTLLQDVS